MFVFGICKLYNIIIILWSVIYLSVVFYKYDYNIIYKLENKKCKFGFWYQEKWWFVIEGNLSIKIAWDPKSIL